MARFTSRWPFNCRKSIWGRPFAWPWTTPSSTAVVRNVICIEATTAQAVMPATAIAVAPIAIHFLILMRLLLLAARCFASIRSESLPRAHATTTTHFNNDLHQRLQRIHIHAQFTWVISEDVFGLAIINRQPMANRGFIGVVEPILFQC